MSTTRYKRYIFHTSEMGAGIIKTAADIQGISSSMFARNAIATAFQLAALPSVYTVCIGRHTKTIQCYDIDTDMLTCKEMLDLLAQQHNTSTSQAAQACILGAAVDVVTNHNEMRTARSA